VRHAAHLAPVAEEHEADARHHETGDQRARIEVHARQRSASKRVGSSFLFGAALLLGLAACSSEDSAPQAAGGGSATGATTNSAGKNGSAAGNGSSTGGANTSGTSGSSGANVSGTSSGGGTPNAAGTTNSSDGGDSGTGEGGNADRGCKRGIAWNGKKLDNPEVNAKLTWWYRWAIGADAVGTGLEFVPMIWGGGTKLADDNKAIRSDAKYLLGYNEPNFFDQANLSAADAAADWPTVEAVAQAHNLKIVSPAVNYCGDAKAMTGRCHDYEPAHYLQAFFDACADCQVDYVAVHWYNCDISSLTWYLDQFKKFNKPIWVTELACAIGDDTSAAGNEKYLREVVPYLEQRQDVFRYSWFSADNIPNARLLNDDGSPTALGKIYLDLPHDSGCEP